MGFIAAYVINLALGMFLGTDLPVVAVVSESMTHDSNTEINHYKYLMDSYHFTREQIDSWPIKNGFLKGDVLIVKGTSEDKLKVGDVIVYNINGQRVPIVHRIMQIDGTIVTKGDHNPMTDGWTPTKVHGKVLFVVPFLGWPKLLLTQLLGKVF